MLGSHDNNGLPLSFRGQTAYLSVAVGRDLFPLPGVEDGEAYIAVGKVSDRVKDALGIKTFMVHLGYFADVRDAAYTAKVFNENPSDYEDELICVGQGRFNIECPVWEYDAIVLSEAEMKKQSRAGRSTASVKRKLNIQGALSSFYGENKDVYKVTGADASKIRATMLEYLVTVERHTNENMMEAARLAFEPYKK